LQEGLPSSHFFLRNLQVKQPETQSARKRSGSRRERHTGPRSPVHLRCGSRFAFCWRRRTTAFHCWDGHIRCAGFRRSCLRRGRRHLRVYVQREWVAPKA